MNHEYFMDKAIQQAKIAESLGEVPIGAVIVQNENIIGVGYNRKEQQKNPVSHAEIEAIYNACKKVGDWRLNSSIIYVTAEPCMMCCGAIIHARISRIIFGVLEPKFGCVCSKLSLLDNNIFNHHIEWLSGIKQDEIKIMMKEFFKTKRG